MYTLSSHLNPKRMTWLAAPFAHAPHPSGPHDVYHPNNLKCRILPLPSHRCIIAGAYHDEKEQLRQAVVLIQASERKRLNREKKNERSKRRLHSAMQGLRSRRATQHRSYRICRRRYGHVAALPVLQLGAVSGGTTMRARSNPRTRANLIAAHDRG